MLRYFWPSDDEQLAGQWQDSHFDEDGSWWANVQQCGAALALVVAATLTSASTAVASSVFSQSQDDPAGSLALQFVANEEYWQNPTPPVNWPQPSVFTDDNVHVQFVQTFTPDDGDWAPLVPSVQATNYVWLPFLDPDEIPQLPTTVNVVDEQDPWAPQVPPADPNWTLLFFLDDGSTVPVFQPDEDFWAPQIAPPDSQGWTQPAQPFTATDETVPEFVAEDVFWLQLAPPIADSLLWPQPWVFEQNEQAASLASFTDELFWQNPSPPVPDSLYVLRQDLFDDQVPAGSLTLTLDDSYQPNIIPGVPFPDPGSLVLLQQWPFEQNEPAGSLRNTVDEDFWQNPVAPVVWPQPSVFVFDELVGPQPTTTIDEIYWSVLVPPIPASNWVALPYVPDPEEIPAGSLKPAIPPPPPAPCVMPAGFDADTNISTFSNFKGGPVLALLCRICKSGKPLLVRGDYAIWCQDCCAFVSKQDTVMGTVRAPGAFRSRF